MGPAGPGGPDGPVYPGGPRLPGGPGEPGIPGSYRALAYTGSPFKPLKKRTEEESLECWVP